MPRVRTDLLNRRSIETRPKVINERRRVGDWERDLMFGGDSRSEALLTLVERKTNYVILRRLRSKSPAEVAQRAIEALSPTCENLNGLVRQYFGSTVQSRR
ncbi:MAG: hypothetical protein NDJ89_09325 [Oligoflexia bacterium]|nr:hypothetical protein [Oligoflexia bacterium]